MADDFYIQEMEDYVEGLCRSHTDVLHNPPAKVCFSRLRSQDEVNQLINNAGKNVVIMGRMSGRAVGDAIEQKLRQEFVLRFACYAEVASGTQGIDDAIDLAQDIMFDFISKMRVDAKDDQNDCGPLRYVELNNISWNEIDEPIYLENHYGWDLIIPISAYFPPYNALKWQ